jgi:hypothetical protein
LARAFSQPEREARSVFEDIFMHKQRDDQEISPLTGAAYPRSRSDVIDDDRDRHDDDDDRERDDDDDDIEKQADHHASTIADLLVEAGSFPHRAAALQHLLHKPEGQALLRRMHKAAEQPEKESTMDKSLQAIAKDHGVPGVVEIAKNIVDEQKSFRLTEDEFCKLIDTAARVAHPELGARAFEKVYERNPLLAKAIAVIKAGLAEQLLSGGMPVQVVGGEDARDVNDPKAALEAYARLQEIGRQKWPSASEAVQFTNAFTDPANRKLAAKAHRRPTPPAGGAYPMPR